MRAPISTALLVVAALLLAGCSHRVEAAFTVWNYTTQPQAGAFRLIAQDGTEAAAFPFAIEAPAGTVTYTTPEHGQVDVAPGTYTLWAGVSGNRTVEEARELGSSVKGISLQIYDDRLEFVLAVT